MSGVKEIDAAGEAVTAVSVIALLMGVIGAQSPLLVEGMLDAAGDVDGV